MGKCVISFCCCCYCCYCAHSKIIGVSRALGQSVSRRDMCFVNFSISLSLPLKSSCNNMELVILYLCYPLSLTLALPHFLTIHLVHRFVHLMDSVITPTHVSRSIYDQCRLDPDFSLLIENIDFVRLTDLVDRDLPLTMLVAPNRAFERITFGATEGGDVIRQHIFRGLLFTDVLANMTEVTSVPPQAVTHTIERKGPDGEYLYVGGAYIYEGDILTRNGVMHRVDRVIGYEYPTVAPSQSPAPTATPMPTVYVPPTAAPAPFETGPGIFTWPPNVGPPTKAPKKNNNGANDSGSAHADTAYSNHMLVIAVAAMMLLGVF